MNESSLINYFGRTKMNADGFKQLVFENSYRSLAFESFRECFDTWLIRGVLDKTINVESMFNLDQLPGLDLSEFQ